MASITPFLWFAGRVGEAAEFYTSVFGDGVILESSPGPDGDLMMARLSLGGTEVILFNGGPHFTLTPVVSLFVSVQTQDEVDRYWDQLLAGGEESRCGWLIDKFGLSWQIIPTLLGELMGSPDQERAGKAVQAMLGMNKIVMADLQAAYDS